jgi:glycine cleavage system transcriptional repressor
VTLLAVTVLGHDRPGIIADTTRLLAGLGANLEDSTMTILRGHFAMVLVASADAEPGAVEAALAPLGADGRLQVAVRAVPQEAPVPALGSTYLLSVHGADRPGIVSAVTGVVAEAGGNITDLSTRLSGGLYVLLAEVDLATSVDPEQLGRDLVAVGSGLGIEVSLRVLDQDLL